MNKSVSLLTLEALMQITQRNTKLILEKSITSLKIGKFHESSIDLGVYRCLYFYTNIALSCLYSLNLKYSALQIQKSINPPKAA